MARYLSCRIARVCESSSSLYQSRFQSATRTAYWTAAMPPPRRFDGGVPPTIQRYECADDGKESTQYGQLKLRSERYRECHDGRHYGDGE